MNVKGLADKLLLTVKRNWERYEKSAGENAVDILEFELGEMENIFALLVLGSFVGFPSPPMQISLELLPEMEDHLKLMINKVDMANEPLSNLFSVFEVI